VGEAADGEPLFSSSIDWLLAAMAQGVRSVDVQFAENDELSLPCVVEADGATVSSTSIVDVLQAVATHAFEASPFPLILHLDLRTTTNGSAVVRRELKRRLGELLFTQEDMAKLRRGGLTLSPANLLRKVLVSTCVDDKTAVAVHASMPEDSPSRALAAGVGLHCLSKVVALPVLTHDKVGWGASSEETDVAIVHRHELVGGTGDVVSGGDRRHRKWAENTRKSLLYLRPSAPTSANPPLEQTMRHGLQFAGMNIPLGDEVGREYEQMFQSVNGGCGYLLKPPSMRLARRAPDDATFRFSVAVIQGMHMPRPPAIETAIDAMDRSVHPGVRSPLTPLASTPHQRDAGLGRFKVALHFSSCNDVETDPGTYFEWNQTTESLSYCPTFDSITTGPRDARIRGVELGVVTFRLHYTAGVTSVPVAEATLPVRSLRVGYRAVALFAADTNRPLQASLLCHFGMLRI
jgi:phosphatidylinositol phospholipase C delta